MIQISNLQKENSLISLLKNDTYKFCVLQSDFQINTIQILFLSLKYHISYPSYIHSRISELIGNKNKKFLMLKIDLKRQNYEKNILEIQEITDSAGFVLLLTFSDVDCVYYLENIVKCHTKRAETLRLMKNDGEIETGKSFIASFPKFNKTDYLKIKQNNLSIKEFLNNKEKLKQIGIGDKKIGTIEKFMNMKF